MLWGRYSDTDRRSDLAALWRDLADRARARGDLGLARQRQINADYWASPR